VGPGGSPTPYRALDGAIFNHTCRFDNQLRLAAIEGGETVRGTVCLPAPRLPGGGATWDDGTLRFRMTEFDDVYDHFVALAGAPDIADPNEAARSDAYAEVAAVPGVVADDGDTAIQDGAGGGLLLPWWAWGSIAVAVVTALCGVSKVRAKARGARECPWPVRGPHWWPVSSPRFEVLVKSPLVAM